MARPSKYPEQFRRDAVDLVRSPGRPTKHVTDELGLNPEVLRLWVRKAEAGDAGPGDGGGLSVDEAELLRLRARLAEVEKEKGSRSRPGNNVHQKITNMWADFQKAAPSASRSSIEMFEGHVHNLFGGGFWE